MPLLREHKTTALYLNKQLHHPRNSFNSNMIKVLKISTAKQPFSTITMEMCR